MTMKTMKPVKTAKTKLVPPDGGWGWVVLVSALLVNFLIPGTVKSFGVLFVEFLQVFKASPTAASWMPALCYFLYSSLGPLSSVLSMKFSYKTVTLIGGTFAASGMMLSYFADSVSYLYVSYGLMVGIGAGLTFPPTVYIVTAYFERLRGFANGLCISGSAIGTIVLPPFLQYLLNHFGYRGAVLIMGAITLNTLVCALLYHPVEQHMKVVPIAAEEGIDNEALTLDEPASNKLELDLSKPNRSLQDAHPREETAAQLSSLSQILEKTSCDILNEKARPAESSEEVSTENHRNLESEVDQDKLETTLESEVDSGTTPSVESERVDSLPKIVVGPSLLSRNNSVQRPVKHESFHLSRQHSIVSEMGPIALSPRLNVPGMFRRLFKTQSPRKSGSEKDTKSVTSCTGSKSDKSQSSGSSSSNKFFDFGVLRDPIYLVIMISNSTSAISNTNFMILLPSYAISQGFDKNMAALLLSIVSALDLIGRIGGASLSDIDFIPKYYYFVGGLGTSGIALALLPMANSYSMLSFFCALFGLSSGIYIGITTVILADMLGPEKLSSSYGISLFVNGVLQLVGPPVCGTIYEHVGSYKPIFLAFGIILILGTALWAALPIIKRNGKKDVEAG
ncbi:monocarboxylate transporter 13 [Orussus abietinus]|uniref:monocarboxylate transporter 13 n=1 Tax=Orussus abietinus TaxID=222816 RepID=UPI000624FF77|nr:monocarboxylate transporter 13 [Orussus abietinus]XP_012280354.1 monocarboxylate transporter 13 [Orussus abietinus]